MSAANDLITDALGRVGASVPNVVEGLSEDQLAHRPAEGANPIGWLVWHLSRVLDDHLATLAEEDQVWTTGGYADRCGLDLPAEDTGFGHSSEEVAKVRVSADLLADYHRAVQEHYASYLAGVGDLEEVIDDRWDPPVTRGARLISLIDECARHTGQAEYVRGLLPG